MWGVAEVGSRSGFLLRCRRSSKQSLGADVLVDLRPVNAVAASGNLPIAALLGGSLEQPWIPGERDRDGAAVLQAHAQRVLIERNISDPLICRDCQNTHPKHPTGPAGWPARLIVLVHFTGAEPRFRARPPGSSQNFAERSARPTGTCGGSLGSWL